MLLKDKSIFTRIQIFLMFTVTIFYEYQNQTVQENQHTTKTISQDSICKLFRKDLKKDILDQFFLKTNKDPNRQIIKIFFIDLEFERIQLEQKQAYYFAQKQSLSEGRKLTIILSSKIQFQFKNKYIPEGTQHTQFIKSTKKQDKKNYFKGNSIKEKIQSLMLESGWKINKISQLNKNKVQEIDNNSNQFQILQLEQLKDIKSQEEMDEYSFELLRSSEQSQILELNTKLQSRIKILDQNKNPQHTLMKDNTFQKKYNHPILCSNCRKQLNFIALPTIFNYQYCEQCESYAQSDQIMPKIQNDQKNLCKQKSFLKYERKFYYQDSILDTLNERIKKRENKQRNRQKIKNSNKYNSQLHKK